VPVYAYKCYSCKHEFEVRHGMFFESQRCIKCYSDDIQRLPTEIYVEKNKQNSNTSANPPGKLVDQFIEDVKKEVKQEKENLKKQEIK
tara:strand:- start:1699 stop:1962 length:264 start_codon:yes stop_codon:yes gene_type:complete